MAAKRKVVIEVVPTSGSPTKKEVQISPGTTVKAALQQAGLSDKHKNLTVDGMTATLDTTLGSGKKSNKIIHVRMEERPAGS